MGFIELRGAAQQLLDQMLSDGVLVEPEHPRRVAVEDLRAALAEHYCDTHCTWANHDQQCAWAEPGQEPQCNPHPKAPHSFMRNASHTEHRYVCECEGWEPYEAGYQAGMEAALAEPVHEPPTDWEAVAADQAMTIALNTAPSQRKPLTVMELQDALVYTDLIDPDAVNDPEGYDEGSTLAQIDELHRILTA